MEDRIVVAVHHHQFHVVQMHGHWLVPVQLVIVFVYLVHPAPQRVADVHYVLLVPTLPRMVQHRVLHVQMALLRLRQVVQLAAMLVMLVSTWITGIHVTRSF
jgi:hypothetical protein